jgi:hypothetical protein
MEASLEHPLGKGEVVSSILTGSTTEKPMDIGNLLALNDNATVPLRAERAATCRQFDTFLTR